MIIEETDTIINFFLCKTSSILVLNTGIVSESKLSKLNGIIAKQ